MSVSKTLTTVAVLQLLRKNKLTIDSEISPYIYSDWHQGKNVDKITFKQLLTRTSGFGQVSSCGNDFTYATLKTLVDQGVDPTNIGVPQYGNCNFSLVRELLPALSGQPIDTVPDGSKRAEKDKCVPKSNELLIGLIAVWVVALHGQRLMEADDVREGS